MDGGAWWAAVYGVTQSQTRLKQLSLSSSRMVCVCVCDYYNKPGQCLTLRTLVPSSFPYLISTHLSGFSLKLLPLGSPPDSQDLCKGFFCVLPQRSILASFFPSWFSCLDPQPDHKLNEELSHTHLFQPCTISNPGTLWDLSK